MINEILKDAELMASELTAIRRDLHSHPELGWTEMRTSALIARRLTDLNFDQVLTGTDVCHKETRMGLPSCEILNKEYLRAESQGADPEFLSAAKDGFTGVVGILYCGDGPIVALRFDIDALPIQETKSNTHRPYIEGFCSENDGIMHACGHDGHTTIGLGTAAILSKYKEQLHGTVKFIFQPAEEGVRGAKSIVEKGHLNDVNYVLASHLGGDHHSLNGQIAISNNATLATTKMDVIFKGNATHAAVSPELGQNALLAAATAVLNLHAAPRHSHGATRINVGKLTAGTGRNIVCDRSKLEMEVRGATTKANEYMLKYTEQIIKGAAAMHQCEAEITLMGAAKCGINSPELTKLVQEICSNQLNLPCITLEGETSASEDYSFMSDYVMQNGGQSCYFNNITPCAGSFHNELFDFDESALVTGVKVFCGITAELLK